MTRAAALGLCLAACVSPRVVLAQDWLAAFEPPTAAAPGLQLYYPRAELPAVVAAGDVLTARLQLTAAMTPPPGVQQARALKGFAAALRGDGLALGTSRVHRHRLHVLSLRPDAGSSLVYRVKLRVPAFVAPGTYAFELTTPFGARAALRAVRIIPEGTQPQLAKCPQATTPQTPKTFEPEPDLTLTASARTPDRFTQAELGTLPVDVWICPHGHQRLPDSPGRLGLAPAPELHVASAPGSFALRVGRSVWRADLAPGSHAFERELRSVLTLEQRTLTPVGPDALPTALPTLPAAMFESPGSVRSPSEFSVESGVERRLALLLPAGRALPRTDAQLTLYPATDLRLRDAGSVLALVWVRAGSRVGLQVEPTSTSTSMSMSTRAGSSALAASRARAGHVAELRVTDAPRDARVAYEWGDRSALSGPALRARVDGPLEEPARALVMSRGAGAQLLRTHVLVEADRPPSCSLQPPPRRAQGGPFAWLLLCTSAMLLKIRRRRGAWE